MLDPQQVPPSFTPVICYPKHARAGETYLLTIDVRLDEPDLGWTLPEEDYQIFFQLKTQPCFSYQPLGEHEPSVILHRFGGTYGPAEYKLTTAETEIEKGKISVTLINRRGIPIGYTELECSVSSKNKGVVEADTAMSRPVSTPVPGKVSIDKDTRVMGKVDVCVICALAEEIRAFRNVLEKQGALFQMKHSQRQHRDYYYTTILNIRGEEISISVIWPAYMGTTRASPDFEKFLQELEPRFIAITGICVGNPKRVQLGDLIVADRILIYNTSLLPNKSSQQQQLHDTARYQIHNDILQFTRLFSEWENAVEPYKKQRPISKKQQKDWLLNQLFEKEVATLDLDHNDQINDASQKRVTIYDLDREELASNAPDWREILNQLLQEEPPLIDKETLALRDPEGFEHMISIEEFPYKDTDNPLCNIGGLATGNSVRTDNPFSELEKIDRKILGLDMEGTGIYSALRENPHIRFLVAKGVSGYPNEYKDDSYHSYAATISAAYVASFIAQFVNNEYMPNQRIIPATASLQLPNSSSTSQANEPTKQPVKIFISCSESDRDQRLISKLNTHLAILTRGKPPLIERWDRHYIEAGSIVREEAEKILGEAQIVLLMMSPDYYASDFYEEEIEQIEQRRLNGARVIPILLRSTDDGWKNIFSYGDLVSLPRNGRAVTTWSNQDEILSEIAIEITRIAENIQNS